MFRSGPQEEKEEKVVRPIYELVATTSYPLHDIYGKHFEVVYSVTI